MELDYDKLVSNAHLEAAGWGMDAFNHSNPFESHVIYVRDYRNDHIRLFTIKQADFDTIKQPLHLTSDMLASVIAEFISKAAKGTLNTKESNTLAPALVGYAKSTETYRSWRRVSGVGERLHMVINIYAGSGLLRPFIARAQETVLTTQEVLVFSSQVKDLDISNHPEWFRGWR
ncbi:MULTISPECIES: hypothetical protein [Gammaproteobacteria]|uniref:hypothetical protein n=1 Tax=Gammaproteobacteria TaxID=1236 RepID=UPI000791DD9A|nr:MULTISPECIES: hypothetical protein [Gammaproteobacteria]EHQ7937243.1 hypothetical protein [Salmonella enterica]MCB3578746.1 hypothetical protein [Klebsiella pneumoniae]SAE49982.1 Uncharacterised protein [Enterobacter cloacae]EHW6159977.1 hypothetical protein [Salmonella enterica]EID5355652.1 hypothetical protein [Salmonella enterica]